MWEVLKRFVFGAAISQERRNTPIPGPKPALGGYIAKRDIAMKVTGPLSLELWHWLMLMGWREVKLKTNRRTFYRLPKDALEKLINANPTERERIHNQLIKQYIG